MLRIQIVPYFLVFPVAFTLNRLGQHYNIDPTHPLKWSTVMKPSRLWDFLFVYSNYHAEHHYFPSVPFYNLRKLHLRLRPLYDELRIERHTYREIVWQWFVLNRAPHTDWSRAGAPGEPGSPTGGPSGPTRRELPWRDEPGSRKPDGRPGQPLVAEGSGPGGEGHVVARSARPGRPAGAARSSAPCPRASRPTGRASPRCAGWRRARGTCRAGKPMAW